MKSFLIGLLAIGCACGMAATESSDNSWLRELNAYDVVWDGPSSGSADSMPLSGHNLGLNVWVEKNDILMLMASPNCMDENGMQVKLGLIRLKFSEPTFVKSFRQTLHLSTSEIVIRGDTADNRAVSVTLWCESGHTNIHANVTSEKPLGITVCYESWSSYQARWVNNGIQWFRRLPDENARRMRDMTAQGVVEFAAKIPDPLSRLTMGGRVDARGMVSLGSSAGTWNGLNTRVEAMTTAAPVTEIDVAITLRMDQDASIAQWEKQVQEGAVRANKKRDTSRAEAREWWTAFWNRSHITMQSSHVQASQLATDTVWQAGRNYQLIRYMLAANTSGRAMTLFNGGQFSCTGNPDKRNWDYCQFMAQNQRLVYWPMLSSGDFDMLKVACDFYRDRMEIRRCHTKKFWNVDGAAWPEPLGIFGLDAMGTNGEGRSAPEHLRYHYTSSMEFALMMLAYGSYTGDQVAGYQDPALGIISYYDQFYQGSYRKKTGKPLDDGGHLVIYPSDACETYHGCTNNTDVLAGLTALTRELLNLPAKRLSSQQRAYVEGFRNRIPPFSIKEKDGRKYYAAAESWERVLSNGNMEFPQMYICFPFTILSLGRSDMSLARNTWDLSPVNPAVQRQNQCWYQSAIQFARMGDTMAAARLTLGKLHTAAKRFPVFYETFFSGSGGAFCHVPDMDHGGCSMIALQNMLLQVDGKRILVTPAWPMEWDARFVLHAPYKTTIEGRVQQGQVFVDKVDPESRRTDIEIMPLKNGVDHIPLSQGKPVRASSTWRDAGYDATKAVDGNHETRWGGAGGERNGWLEVDLEQPRSVSRIVVEEVAYPSTTEFAIEAPQADGTWKSIANGTTIGNRKELRFAPVTVQKIRLNLISLSGNPNIEEFQVFEK
jgi:hypothetical protein